MKGWRKSTHSWHAKKPSLIVLQQKISAETNFLPNAQHQKDPKEPYVDRPLHNSPVHHQQQHIVHIVGVLLSRIEDVFKIFEKTSRGQFFAVVTIHTEAF